MLLLLRFTKLGLLIHFADFVQKRPRWLWVTPPVVLTSWWFRISNGILLELHPSQHRSYGKTVLGAHPSPTEFAGSKTFGSVLIVYSERVLSDYFRSQFADCARSWDCRGTQGAFVSELQSLTKFSRFQHLRSACSPKRMNQFWVSQGWGSALLDNFHPPSPVINPKWYHRSWSIWSGLMNGVSLQVTDWN